MSKRPIQTQAADVDGAEPKRKSTSGRSGGAGRASSASGSSKRAPASSSSTSKSSNQGGSRTAARTDGTVPIKVEQPNPSVPTTMHFNSKVETCEICCNDALPSSAVKLPCRHGWYCSTCITRHAQARLATGAVDVQCPECREHIQEHDLRQLLSKETINRFQARSLEQAVASSPNLYLCPTPNCTMCVEVEDGEEPWLERCPKCKKSSCLLCGAQPYHRGLTCDAHARTAKDKKAEAGLRRWMEKTGAKQCPKCKIAVTKENLDSQRTQYRECHKMMCRSCRTKFCFKCLAVLTDTYTCGCSIDGHGFVDPVTGERLEHLQPELAIARATAKQTKAQARGVSTSKVQSGSRGRGRGLSKN